MINIDNYKGKSVGIYCFNCGTSGTPELPWKKIKVEFIEIKVSILTQVLKCYVCKECAQRVGTTLLNLTSQIKTKTFDSEKENKGSLEKIFKENKRETLEAILSSTLNYPGEKP